MYLSSNEHLIWDIVVGTLKTTSSLWFTLIKSTTAIVKARRQKGIEETLIADDEHKKKSANI